MRLKDDESFLIRGKWELKEGEEKPRLIVSDLSVLDSALRMMARSIRVRVDMGSLPETVLPGIKRVLSNHPGEIGVSLELVKPAEFMTLIRTQDKLRVKLSAELVQQLEGLTGSGTVRLSRSA